MEFYEQFLCNYDLRWAIDNGWAVPPICKLARVESLDLSGVKIVGGDFHQQQLQTELNKEANLQRLCMITAEEREGQTVLFTGSVFQMHGATHYLTNNYGISAVEVWGTQPEEERNEALRKFKTKEVQVLVNCQVVAVGFDYPPTATLVLGRPTRSRSFWLQCVGRATRPLPGTVDFAGSTPASRIASIAGSGKRHFKIVDCTTGSVDHSIITAIDMFVTDEEVKKRVREAAHAKALTPEEIAELAAQEAAKLAAAKQIEEMRKATQGRGAGNVRTEDIDIRFQGKRSVGTYRNPLRGKFHHWPMNRLPDFYIRWGTKNTNGWVRQLFIREEMRREKQTA